MVVDDIIANRLKLLAEYVDELQLYRRQATNFQGAIVSYLEGLQTEAEGEG